MKFEVGKKYTGAIKNLVYECVFETKMHYLMRYKDVDGIHELLWNKNRFYEGFKEYHEPVKRWFNKYRVKETNEIFLAGNGWTNDSAKRLCGYDTEEQAKYAVIPLQDKYKYLGPIEIEF